MFQHGQEVAAEGVLVAGFGRGVVGDRDGAEEDAEHGAGPMDLDGSTGLGSGVFEAVCQYFRFGTGFFDVIRVFCDEAQRFQSGCHGQGVAAEGTGLVDRAGRRDAVHDVFTAAIGCDGQAAADDLAQGRHVRDDVIDALGAVQGRAEAAHDFVEDEDRAMLLCFVTQELQIAFFRQDQAHVAGNGFDDDGGNVVAAAVHEFPEGVGIVIGDGQCILGRAGCDAWAVGLAEGGGTGTGFDQQAVAVAVIAADEFHDFIASRIAAGGADGAHRRFRAGIDHAQFFDGRVDFFDQFGQLRFNQRRGAIARAARGRFLQGLDDARVGMADDHGTPGTDVVDVLIAVDVTDGTAFGPGDERRRTADTVIRADRAVDSARHEGLRFGKSRS